MRVELFKVGLGEDVSEVLNVSCDLVGVKHAAKRSQDVLALLRAEMCEGVWAEETLDKLEGNSSGFFASVRLKLLKESNNLSLDILCSLVKLILRHIDVSHEHSSEAIKF